MSDFTDPIGTAVQGGLFARALEPDSGARQPHPDQPAECLNCGMPLTGAFCHACGQKGHLHRTIGAFMHDLLHGALHFEGKLWRTLPMLFFRPGRLTRRYIDGERARFVSPMALFLFTVFLMFAIFQVLGISTPTNVQSQIDDFQRGYSEARTGEAPNNGSTGDAADFGQPTNGPQAVAEIEAERDRLQAQLDELPEGDPARADVEAELAATQTALQMIDGAESLASGEGDFHSGVRFIDDKLVAKWRENPALMLYKLQANAYKFSWLLIPISISFVWLLFAWRRRFKAYDHAIFVTYSLSFMTLLFIALSMLGATGISAVLLAIPLLLIPPVHLYKQLRYTYDLSRLSAFWRLLMLSAFIWIVIALFLQILFLLGAF